MNIIVGITGGIAAYKAPELVRLLKKAGHEVRCAATGHALEFVTKATLETVSGNALYSDLFASGGTEHISLKDWGDMLVVAPATANIIGKVANGIADDALSTLLLAFSGKPVVMAPAMNCEMWAHPAVQHNVALLKSRGIRMAGPDEGELACGANGIGRMAEPAEIAAAALSTLHTPLSSQRWLVTAGPTYERIDSVRFIGNYSSGKMGFALAQALADAGADVELVSGPTALAASHPGVTTTRVESAREMYAAATAVFPQCDGAILSAAVADYRPAECADHKLKKNGRDDAGAGAEPRHTGHPRRHEDRATDARGLRPGDRQRGGQRPAQTGEEEPRLHSPQLAARCRCRLRHRHQQGDHHRPRRQPQGEPPADKTGGRTDDSRDYSTVGAADKGCGHRPAAHRQTANQALQGATHNNEETVYHSHRTGFVGHRR